MTRRNRFPRIGESNALRPDTEKTCSAMGCSKQATHFTFVQFTWMRGEDEGVHHCGDHKHTRGHDPESVSAWCKQFPTEAWK